MFTNEQGSQITEINAESVFKIPKQDFPEEKTFCFEINKQVK